MNVRITNSGVYICDFPVYARVLLCYIKLMHALCTSDRLMHVQVYCHAKGLAGDVPTRVVRAWDGNARPTMSVRPSVLDILTVGVWNVLTLFA